MNGARNEKVKLTIEDKWAKKYYGHHAHLSAVRSDKKKNNKRMRVIDKKEIQKGLDEIEEM